MDRVDGLIRRARRLLLAGRAVSWLTRGLAVAALLALAVELLVRAYPVDPLTPLLLGCLAIGLLVAAGGWFRAWPSRAEVARLADFRLGGLERLSTAVEFATAEGVLVWRQRQDAAAWAESAELAAVRDPGRPFRAAVLALVAGLAVVALGAIPNPALQSLKVERANQAAQDRAAAQIGQLIQQADKGQAGESPAQKAALVQQLKTAQQAARTAPDPQSAVAALSQAQSQIRSLQDSNVATQKQAASAAGQSLQPNPSSAKAGQALSAGDSQAAASELNRLAASLPTLSPAEQQALAASLSAAAAQSASGNPKLSQALQQAAAALRKGDTAGAQQALQQAAQAQQQQAGAEQFNGDASQAINGLQQAKQQLAQQAQQAQAQGQPSGQSGQAGAGQLPGTTQAGQGQPGQQGQPGGPGAGTGQQGQGQGAGAGNGNANGNPGSGAGSGQGSGSGGGKTTASTEKIYVPGQSTGSGTPQGNAGDPNSGSSAQLVPYTDYLSQYRAGAQSEVDRQVIPQDERDLVRQYFQDLGQ